MADADFRSYVEAWRRRLAAEREREAELAREAWAEAERLARWLREKAGAREVWAFGSLALSRRGERTFHERSEIDLAVRGIPPADFYTVYGRLLMESRFPLDLVDLDDAPAALREAVLREGVPLGP